MKTKVSVDELPSVAADRRLTAILHALPPSELAALVKRMGIAIDPKKRIDAQTQVARALVRLPELREPSRLPSPSVELLHRIVEAQGSLVVVALPGGVETLVRRGVVYARVVQGGIELMLPTAFLVQLPSWEGEDPRSLRALLADAPFETASAVATYHLGRPATPPIALSLEPAWEALGDGELLAAEVGKVSHQERQLLDAIDQIGGEVDTQELMDLERQPMRVRGVYGVAAGRRGGAFALEKRGLLYPIHPNRYVIPTEVAAIIGAERIRRRKRRRARVRSHVIAEDHLPRRARFSLPAASWALAMAMAMRQADVQVKPTVGTPRSFVAKLAHRFGRETEAAALVVALSRAIGLWEGGATSSATPPGALHVHELSRLLFDTWRRGGAWDEARAEPELLRVAKEIRDPSPVGVLREMVLEALQDLGEGHWVLLEALRAYLADDPRRSGLERLLERWASRGGIDVPDIDEVAERILLQSLPALGAVDLGGADVEATSSGESASLALRLTARGRAYIAGDDPVAEPRPSEFVKPRLLRVGQAARVAEVLALSACTDVAAVEPDLDLSLSGAALSRGVAAGVEPAEMQARLEALAPLDKRLERVLKQAGTIVGKATLTPVSGFLWVEDEEVRELLRTRPPAAELFVDPSPPTGLLIAPAVEAERLVQRCRALGVEVDVEQGVARVRHSSAPPKKSETLARKRSWRPPAAGGGRSR